MRTDTLLRLVRRVLTTPTAPGHEDAVADLLAGECAAAGAATTADRHGNLVARLERRARGVPPLVFVAHMDHPAFTYLGGDRAEFHGGVPDATFAAGARVRFADGSRARCLRRLRSRPARRRVVRLDRGLPGLAPGTPGRWDLPLYRLRGNRIAGWGIDDLLGCAALVAVLRDLARGRERLRAWALFTRREEIGLLGSLAAARDGRVPKRALVVSVETSQAAGRVAFGAGPVLRVGDARTVFDPLGSRFLRRAAAGGAGRPAIPLQRALMDGGTCEGTAWFAHGYRSAALCLPLGNYHNVGPAGRPGAEYADLDDLRGLVRLGVRAARDWPGCDWRDLRGLGMAHRSG